MNNDTSKCSSCGGNAHKCSCGVSPAVVQINNPDRIALFHKVVIPSSLGDETVTPPFVGKFCNVLMVYQANGHAYLYSSDGIPTAIGFDSGGILVVDEFPEIEQAAQGFLYIKTETGEAQITDDGENWTVIAGHYGAVYAVDAQPDAAEAEKDSLYVNYQTGEAWLTHDNTEWITVNETGGKVLLVENFPDVADARLGTLYISSTDQEARITNDNENWVSIQGGGGGGGTTDFDLLSNRPKYAGAVMTSTTDIPDVSLVEQSLSSSLAAETLARQQADAALRQDAEAILAQIQQQALELTAQIANKVDKVTGKGLSTNDFTNAYKTLLESAIQPSDLNYTVMTDLSLPTNPSTTSVILTADKVNLGTGVTSDEEIALPVASTTQAGIINKATYDTIQDNAEKIDAILGGAVAVAGIAANPTQAALTTAWQTATGLTDLINGASILDTDNSLKWTYYTNDTTWHSASISGSVSVNQFTNTELGTIKGSTTVGQVFAEPNGTGSVNGWDALTARVTTAESTLANKVDKVTGKGLSTNDFTDALKTKLDGIEDEAQKNRPIYSTTGSNTDGAMTQAATTNAIALKLSHGNLTTSGGLEKTVTGSGTNTAIDVKIADGGVSTTKIADNAVTTAKLADGSVTTVKLADNAVTTAKITDLNVTTAKIANGAITGVANDATAIGTAKLALDTVGTPNLRDQSVTSEKIDWTTMEYRNKTVAGARQWTHTGWKVEEISDLGVTIPTVPGGKYEITLQFNAALLDSSTANTTQIIAYIYNGSMGNYDGIEGVGDLSPTAIKSASGYKNYNGVSKTNAFTATGSTSSIVFGIGFGGGTSGNKVVEMANAGMSIRRVG